MNAIYAAHFGDRLPARTCIGVSGLAAGADIEIHAVALRNAPWHATAAPAQHRRSTRHQARSTAGRRPVIASPGDPRRDGSALARRSPRGARPMPGDRVPG
ncbi:MAG TPA: hypothetical protein VGQ42_05225 [Candidatus Dormibacteraeota bacterium]|nr:hypothetical protein [Candidatus Dormibacteraeota bacterium]